MDGDRRFHDLVRAGAALNYPTRCRLVVDEVVRRHGRLTDPADAHGARDRAWLEEELGAAAAAALSPAEMRSWAWLRLGSPDRGARSRGSESRSAWSLLMSPLPTDEEELWWLASSNGLGVAQLRALLDPTAPPAAVRSGPEGTS